MAKENFLKYQNGVSADENVDELHSRLQKLLQEGKIKASDVEHDEVDSDISENDSSSDPSSSSDSSTPACSKTRTSIWPEGTNQRIRQQPGWQRLLWVCTTKRLSFYLWYFTWTACVYDFIVCST